MPNDRDKKLHLLFEHADDRARILQETLSNNRAEGIRFLDNIVLPAYNRVKELAEQYGRSVKIRTIYNDESQFPGIELTITLARETEFGYLVEARFSDFQIFADPYVLDKARNVYKQTAWPTVGGYFIYAVTTDIVLDGITNDLYRCLW